jgi:hypothetical protein
MKTEQGDLLKRMDLSEQVAPRRTAALARHKIWLGSALAKGEKCRRRTLWPHRCNLSVTRAETYCQAINHASFIIYCTSFN